MIELPAGVYGLLKYFEKAMGLADKKENEDDDVKTAVMRAIVNGTPLPKGHGDLKDMNEFINSLKGFEILFTNDELRCSLLNAISNVPTIIEADNKSKE